MMKKELTTFAAKMLFLMATISIISCSRAEMDTADVLNEKTAKEDIRAAKFTRAMQTARDAARLLDGESVTRAEHDRQIDKNEIKFIVADNATRSDAEPDTLMYVFNYMDNAGFAVVSAVGESGEMLAVTEQGHFNSMEEIENDGFRFFMEAATVYTDSLRWAEKDATRGGGQTGPEIIILDSVAIDTTIITLSPRITVRWDQKCPYNAFCPYDGPTQCPVGCVAVAVGQILSYFEYPTYWTLTYASGNPTISVNWSVLKDSCTSCTSTTLCSAHLPIAQILRQIGKDISMNYGANGSIAGFPKTKKALNDMGYSTSNVQTYSSSGAWSSIRSGQMVLVGGSRIDDDGNTVGHSWVIDGYKEIVYTFYEYTKPQDMLSWLYVGSFTRTSEYIHINWGWKGDCNGYFYNNGVFKTYEGSYDAGCTHYTHRNYNLNLKMISNIHR